MCRKMVDVGEHLQAPGGTTTSKHGRVILIETGNPLGIVVLANERRGLLHELQSANPIPVRGIHITAVPNMPATAEYAAHHESVAVVVEIAHGRGMEDAPILGVGLDGMFGQLVPEIHPIQLVHAAAGRHQVVRCLLAFVCGIDHQLFINVERLAVVAIAQQFLRRGAGGAGELVAGCGLGSTEGIAEGNDTGHDEHAGQVDCGLGWFHGRVLWVGGYKEAGAGRGGRTGGGVNVEGGAIAIDGLRGGVEFTTIQPDFGFAGDFILSLGGREELPALKGDWLCVHRRDGGGCRCRALDRDGVFDYDV